MKILMISSEAAPLAKAGGLADMVASLTTHLFAMGHDVRLLLPFYRGMNAGTLRRFSLRVKVGFRDEELVCRETRLPDSDAPVYLLEHPIYSDRDGIYGNSDQEFFFDNAKRFALLSRASFALVRALDWYPEVLHSHDWPTALVPVYLRSLESELRDGGAISVFTIHNIGYQGIFSPHDLHYTRLRQRDLCPESGMEMEQLNFLSAAVLCADYISTVSPQYAREIQTDEYGHGLEKFLSRRKEDLFGILNGIDTEVWSPATDSFIPRPFSPDDLAGKLDARKKLLTLTGMNPDEDTAVVGIVSRLVEQKGFHELCGPGEKSLERILETLPCRIIVLGTGERWCEEALLELAGSHRNLSVTIGFDEALAHLIEAGSDFFLMPSRYEPCGLNQMYSLRYGTVPVVRRTGGLADTVVDYFREPEAATGFLFDEQSGEAVYRTLAEALRIFAEEPQTIQAMQRRGMAEDFSWDHSAERYLELYRFGLRRHVKLQPQS